MEKTYKKRRKEAMKIVQKIASVCREEDDAMVMHGLFMTLLYMCDDPETITEAHHWLYLLYKGVEAIAPHKRKIPEFALQGPF